MTTRSLVRGVLVLSLGLAAGRASAQSMDWPLHDLDPGKTRYAPVDQINTTNAGKLAVAWSFDVSKHGDSIARPTPLVVGGLMYVNAKTTLFALNAATGELAWSVPIFPANEPETGEGSVDYKQRGPAYGDGRLYVTSPRGVVSALDAKTGKPVPSFGDGGVLHVTLKALNLKYPGKYAEGATPVSLGYQLTHPPTYHNGTLYVGLSNGDNNIRGGLLIAVDGRTGAIRWVFNTIPQGPEDEGWDIAGPTWRGGPRMGGGVWTTPAIDPQLGLLYLLAGNPSPAYDGSARKGINLFTNALVALHLDTGKLAWHFQAVHHDIWDYDIINGPWLLDATVNGRAIKAVVTAGKTCYLYIVDRQTGAPINPIVETLVPSTSDLPGEEPFPTQPIPYTSRGTPQQPFCATMPMVTDPALAGRARPLFTPLSSKEFVITSPGAGGGANWGASSFSPKTGLLYVVGSNSAQSSRIQVNSDTSQMQGAKGFYASRGTVGPTGMTDTLAQSAYDPVTGLQVWYAEFPAGAKSGSLVTGGDLLFQGFGGTFHAFDARSGRLQWMWKAPEKVSFNTDPLTYQINGKQYVSVAGSNNTVVTFALP